MGNLRPCGGSVREQPWARGLWKALGVRRAALAAPGLLGVSLDALPWRGEYWTLSAWVDRAAIDDFVANPVHQAAMRDIRPLARPADFVFWDAEGQPSWEQARARLRQETSSDP